MKAKMPNWGITMRRSWHILIFLTLILDVKAWDVAIATPVSTPTPSVVVNQAQYDALPIGAQYWLNGKLETKRWSIPEIPDTIAIESPLPAVTPELRSSPLGKFDAGGTGLIALFLIAAAALLFALRRLIYGIKNAAPQPEANQQKAAHVCHDIYELQIALQLWERSHQLFEHAETARIASLKVRAANSTLIGFVFVWVSIIAAILTGMRMDVGYGWGTFFLGMLVTGGIATCEASYRRWNLRRDFVRRQFTEPEPVFVQGAKPPPAKSHPPSRKPLHHVESHLHRVRNRRAVGDP
jgi:hypothetical protein